MSFFQFIYCFLFLIITPASSFVCCKENYREELIEKSNQSIPISNTPLWVELVDYESENYEDNISHGIAYLLLNRQFNIEDKIYYTRKIAKIVSKKALADISQISLPPFNPQQAELILHDLRIIRDGTVIDKLISAKKKIFHPSSGNTEVFFYIDNLHVGDIVDISYSFMLKADELLSDILNLKECAIYKKIAYSCLVGEDKPLFWKTYRLEQEPNCTINAPYKKYSWEINDYKTHFLSDNEFFKESSSQSIRDPLINISISSWDDIARGYAVRQYNKTHFSSEPPQNIVELIEEWKNSYPDLEEQILAAIRLVSDDIYYASIPDDEEEHSTTPYSPEKTLENLYGDCKDKSTLLVAILKLLDVEAYPVLINTEKTYELKEELPNRYFDHVIVTIKHNGNSYFIDPTQNLLGGTLDTYQVPDFGYGLIIKEDSEDLVPITRKFLSKKKSICNISIEGSNGTWSYEGQFFHKIANIIRPKLVPGYVNKEAKGNLADIQDLFPNAEIVYTSPLQIEDDRKANVITKNFALFLKNIGQKTPTGTSFDCTPLVSYLALSLNNIDLSKDYDLEKSLCCFDEEVSRIINIYCDKPPNIEEKKISYRDENMFYSFRLEKLSDTHIQVVFQQKFFTTQIEAAQLPQFIKKLEEFKSHLSIQIEIPD